MAYNIFISHAHQYHDALYNSLAMRLDQQRFDWIDVSVPHRRRFKADAPLSDAELQNLLKAEIESADVVIAIAKPVASRRHWLKWELTTARSLGKPIIAVWRRHVDYNVSRFVIEMAQDLCIDTWRIDDITNAIEIAVARSREDSEQVVQSAEVLSLDRFSEDDVEVAALSGLEGDVVTSAEELALADGEEIRLPAKSLKDVLPLPVANDAPGVLPIPVQQALKDLAARRDALVAAEAPRDVIARPVGPLPGQRINGMRWRWSATID